MAVQVDGSKCAYIKGECDCSSHGGEMTCDCNCDCHSDCGCCSSSSNCLGCAEVCPEDAISRMKRQIAIDEERCTECGVCMSVCAYDALFIAE